MDAFFSPNISTIFASSLIDPFWIVNILPFIKSIDVSNSVNWKVLVVVTIPEETDGTLVCIKNLLKELLRFINPSRAALFVAFLNKLFILSICKTLFVEHSKKFESNLVSKEQI